MNKKGDLPVTILVIGVFGLCSLALLSFFYSSYQIQKSFVGLEVIEKANVDIEANNLDFFSAQETETKFSPGWELSWFKEKIIFSVKYAP